LIKIFLLIFCIGLSSILNAKSYDVLVANKDIKYKSIVTLNDTFSKQVSFLPKHCIPMAKKDFSKIKLMAKHYIRSGRILCVKDLKVDSESKIIFDFGTVQIEKRGKIIFENEKYIKIKTPNGKIQKIYKDGIN
jgi:hypothetical protein